MLAAIPESNKRFSKHKIVVCLHKLWALPDKYIPLYERSGTQKRCYAYLTSYKNVIEWANKIDSRPAVKRGLMVNKVNGDLKQQLHERHHSLDFETGTQDKI